MSARDPETGQFVSGNDMEGIEYADHEVQAISGVLTTDRGLDSDEDTATAEVFEQLNPVSERGIDSDQIAELVAMYRKATIRYGNSGGQSFGNSFFGEASLGVNISGESEEFTSLSQNAPTAESQDITPGNEDANDFLFRVANINEPGILDGVSIGGSVAFLGDNGEGGGGQQDYSERYVNFRDEFGSGPYVDRTDDLTLFEELEVNGSTSQCELEVSYILYWNTETVPEARRNFGRP